MTFATFLNTMRVLNDAADEAEHGKTRALTEAAKVIDTAAKAVDVKASILTRGSEVLREVSAVLRREGK